MLIRHGPELRMLNAMQDSGRYDEIVILAEARIESEVRSYLSGRFPCLTYEQPKPTRMRRTGVYLSALMDSVARRVNRMRGIGHYSYSKRSTNPNIYNKRQDSTVSKWTLLGLTVGFSLLSAACTLFFQDRGMRKVLRKSGCSELVACDHLGGSDAVTYNAIASGMEIHYYLNNHKDLSIRPFVPIAASRMFTWFDEQKKVMLDIGMSHRKISAVGLLRAKFLLNSIYESRPKTQDERLRVLHCCADARRRPYELNSLISIFKLIKNRCLPVSFTLRLNPMGPIIDEQLLTEFDFVDVVGHGWHWNENKFLNFPDAEAEVIYAQQIKRHDIVSALPSTTLVEAWCFNKPIICLLDHSSPDAVAENDELRLCVPESILDQRTSRIAKSPLEFLEILKEMEHVV